MLTAPMAKPALVADLVEDRELERYADGNLAGDAGGGYRGGNQPPD
jgi:hypothetical protein